MTQSLRQYPGSGNASARSSSLGTLRRSVASTAPRLSLFVPREHGLENPPRTPAAMDNILSMMQVAWRQINAARGSTVKLANPEHNLLMSLESARDFMLGMLRDPDPGRRHLEEVFGGDCSRIAQVRAILDAAKLSTRIICDDRVISCMNAVKSVESVLKKDCGAAARLSEAQDKELRKMQQRQMRFEARHLRGEFSPLGGNARTSSTSPFELGHSGEALSRPRSASTSAIPGASDVHPSSDALRETWKVGCLPQEKGQVPTCSASPRASNESKTNAPKGGEVSSSSSQSEGHEAEANAQAESSGPKDEHGHMNDALKNLSPTESQHEVPVDGLQRDVKESKVATEQPEVAGPSEPSEVPTDEESDDVPIPENWGMQRQKRGSLIRPIQLPEHLLEPARLAGYGDSCDVVEFQVGHHEEKIGIAFRILPPAGHLVVERITPGSPAEALRLPKGSRLLCVNGLHTGSIEAENFFDLMKLRPLQLLFLRPLGL